MRWPNTSIGLHALEQREQHAESVDLSSVARVGFCAIKGHASQNKVFWALRGIELVSAPDERDGRQVCASVAPRSRTIGRLGLP
jgi:hypothetical protein